MFVSVYLVLSFLLIVLCFSSSLCFFLTVLCFSSSLSVLKVWMSPSFIKGYLICLKQRPRVCRPWRPSVCRSRIYFQLNAIHGTSFSLALMQLWLISSASTRLAYVLAVLSERWLFTVVHFRLAKGVWIEILSIENLTARAQTAPTFVQKLRR